MSLLVQTTNESLVLSFSQESIVPKSRAETPESPADPDDPASAFSTSSTITTQGDIASTSRSAWRTLASDWPTSDPSRVPTSRISVGRPVSAPRALQNADLPEPGGPSRSTPRARTPSGRPGRRAREQNDLSASRPPRSAKVSPPRCKLSRPDFLSIPALISQRTSGASRPWRTSDRRRRSRPPSGSARRRRRARPPGRRRPAAPPARWRSSGRWPRAGRGPAGRGRRPRRASPARRGPGRPAPG